MLFSHSPVQRAELVYVGHSSFISILFKVLEKLVLKKGWSLIRVLPYEQCTSPSTLRSEFSVLFSVTFHTAFLCSQVGVSYLYSQAGVLLPLLCVWVLLVLQNQGFLTPTLQLGFSYLCSAFGSNPYSKVMVFLPLL